MQLSRADSLPETIETEEALDEVLTRPRAELMRFIREVRSPMLILGAGGKMGPTLAVLARRAADQAGHKLDIIAVSRFADQHAKQWLEQRDIHTIACDLLDREAVKRLPHSENVLYLVGLKFGTSANPALTWAMNTLVPANIAENYPAARIVVLSTGNVYPFSNSATNGSKETDPLTPVGEYANAAVARERIFEHFSQRNGTQVTLLRLFYAAELRYGVLRDIADKIWSGEPVNVSNRSVNCIWQNDANEFVIRALGLGSSPPAVFNLTSQESFSVRAVANRLGELFDKSVHFCGEENPSSLTADTSKLCAVLGPPPTSLETMLHWTAAWVKRGGRSLGKPTHFETRDGKY